MQFYIDAVLMNFPYMLFLTIPLSLSHVSIAITTAGSEGFLNLLPIYVDHILYPTLSDSGYYTEVNI